MPVVDSGFSKVKGRAHSSFHHFSLDFGTSICKCSILVLPPSKSQKNDMKFRNIKSKIWKDIFIISIKYFCRLNYWNSYFYTANSFTGNFYFFIGTTVLQILYFVFVCSDQVFDRLVCAGKNCLT